jgi:Fe2+ transport system protein FeoA
MRLLAVGFVRGLVLVEIVFSRKTLLGANFAVEVSKSRISVPAVAVW